VKTGKGAAGDRAISQDTCRTLPPPNSSSRLERNGMSPSISIIVLAEDR